MLQTARHSRFRPLAAALLGATLLAGPAFAREAGFAQAEWAQDYSSPTTMQVHRSSTPILSPDTIAATEAMAEKYRAIVSRGSWQNVTGAAGLRVGIVGIADRAYEDDGTLVRRTEPGAVIHDADEIRRRTVRMVVDGVIESRNGVPIPVACDTVLVHGDTPGAIDLARSIRAGLESEGVEIAPLADWLG